MFCVFFAEGFEELEAVSAVDVLRRAKIEVITAGVGSRSITGGHGITITCDCEASQIDEEKISGVVLPGGMPGMINLRKSEKVASTVRCVSEKDGYVCAICASPSVLGGLGLLEKKNATCYPGFENELRGATVSSAPVVTDGRLITADGPGSAMAFALEIVAAVCGREQANSLASAMQCR